MRRIAIPLFVACFCFVLAIGSAAQAPGGKSEEKPKPAVLLTDEEVGRLTDLDKRLREGEDNYRQALLIVNAYQATQNAYDANYWKAYADHAKDGVRPETHALNLAAKGFVLKTPAK